MLDICTLGKSRLGYKMVTNSLRMLPSLTLEPQMTINIVNLLLAPPQAFVLALCITAFIFIANHCRTTNKCCPISLDVDLQSGFFPRNQLLRLAGMFEIWERALSHAMETLYLGDDECKAALQQRNNGERRRNDVNSVSK